MVNPPRIHGATLSACMVPEVYPSAAAAQRMTSLRLSFSPVSTYPRYAPPAAEAPEEPIPLPGRIPLVIFTSTPKSAPAFLRTSFRAMVTEFFSGSLVIFSAPGPSMLLMTMPEGILRPSTMSYGSWKARPKVSKPAPMLEVVAGAAIFTHSLLIGISCVRVFVPNKKRVGRRDTRTGS